MKPYLKYIGAALCGYALALVLQHNVTLSIGYMHQTPEMARQFQITTACTPINATPTFDLFGAGKGDK